MSEQAQAGGMATAEEAEAEAEDVYFELRLPAWLCALFGVWLLLALGSGLWLAAAWRDDRGFQSTFGFSYWTDEHANPPVRSLRFGADQLVRDLGRRAAELFARLDRDGNGLVSMTEFEPLVHHVRQDPRHPLTLQAADAGPGGCAGACVQLRYRLEPPAVASFQFYSNESGRLLSASSCAEKPDGPLRELMENLANFSASGAVDKLVAVDAVTLATALLPHSRRQALRVGSPYFLIGPLQFDYFLRKQRRLRPGVYFEPFELALAKLLRPLHRNVFLFPRHGGRASAAVVRALSASHVELLFRLHAELQVATDSSQRSVYLTVAGLEGRALLPRSDPPLPLRFELRLARVAVGNGSLLNCHVEMPHDELLAGQTHFPELSVVMATEQPAVNVSWSEEVPESVAWRRVRSSLLPHLGASFHDQLHSSLLAATAAGRQLHAIVAVGGPDQGCHESARALRDLVLAEPGVQLRLKYYYVNVWINFADLATEAGRSSTLAGLDAEQLARVDELLADSRMPLTAFLLDANLRPLSTFTAVQLQEAMRPPDGLPDPFAAVEQSRPPLTQPTQPEPDPEEARRLEQEAFDSVKKQMVSAYMRFLTPR